MSLYESIMKFNPDLPPANELFPGIVHSIRLASQPWLFGELVVTEVHSMLPGRARNYNCDGSFVIRTIPFISRGKQYHLSIVFNPRLVNDVTQPRYGKIVKLLRDPDIPTAKKYRKIGLLNRMGATSVYRSFVALVNAHNDLPWASELSQACATGVITVSFRILEKALTEAVYGPRVHAAVSFNNELSFVGVLYGHDFSFITKPDSEASLKVVTEAIHYYDPVVASDVEQTFYLYSGSDHELELPDPEALIEYCFQHVEFVTATHPTIFKPIRAELLLPRRNPLEKTHTVTITY